LKNRFLALAGEGIEAHEGGVRIFPRGFLGDRLAEGFDGRLALPPRLVKRRVLEEERDAQPTQLLSPLHRPLLVEVLREKIPRVQVDGRAVHRRLPAMPGGGCRSFELLDVNEQRALGAQPDYVAV
jgi:hypothetical protein